MSRRAIVMAAESRPSLSRNVRMPLSYLAFLVFTTFALYPICRVFNFLFRGEPEVTTSSPPGLTHTNFSALLDSSSMQWCMQAALIALAVAIAGAALTSAVGYWLSRRDTHPRGDAIDRSLIPQILPALILLAPLVFILFRIGQLHFLLWMSALYLVAAAPFCAWQLKRAYDTFSPSVEEAAFVDGCNAWQSFYSIIMPARAPALVLAALFSFVIVWNNCIIVGIVLHDRMSSPLPHQDVLNPINAGSLWAFYSVATFLAALLVGLCVLLFGRFTASDGTADR